MKNHIWIAFVTVCFIACSKSSTPTNPPVNQNESVIDSTVNGSTVKYSVGERFRLDLIVHVDAGFQWDYTMSDTNAVCVDSTTYRPFNPDSIRPGAAAIQAFHFRAFHTGTCSVRLIEHQPWEPNVAPIDTVSFAVKVQ
jgi:predicted secreted protein